VVSSLALTLTLALALALALALTLALTLTLILTLTPACGVVSKKRANSQPPAASSFSCTMTMGKPLASAQRT
jgi:hypothetical protein